MLNTYALNILHRLYSSKYIFNIWNILSESDVIKDINLPILRLYAYTPQINL